MLQVMMRQKFQEYGNAMRMKQACNINLDYSSSNVITSKIFLSTVAVSSKHSYSFNLQLALSRNFYEPYYGMVVGIVKNKGNS
jgi:hypothetical protein